MIRSVVKVQNPWSIFDELSALQKDFNRVFSDAGLVPSDEARFPGGLLQPKVNVAETEKEVTVSAELPGMDEKDVSIEIDEQSLTLQGEKKAEQEEKGKNWHRREYSYGKFYRVIGLPAAVDTGKATARFRKGILEVTLPKREEDQKKRRTLQITNG